MVKEVFHLPSTKTGSNPNPNHHIRGILSFFLSFFVCLFVCLFSLFVSLFSLFVSFFVCLCFSAALRLRAGSAAFPVFRGTSCRSRPSRRQGGGRGPSSALAWTLGGGGCGERAGRAGGSKVPPWFGFGLEPLVPGEGWETPP